MCGIRAQISLCACSSTPHQSHNIWIDFQPNDSAMSSVWLSNAINDLFVSFYVPYFLFFPTFAMSRLKRRISFKFCTVSRVWVLPVCASLCRIFNWHTWKIATSHLRMPCWLHSSSLSFIRISQASRYQISVIWKVCSGLNAGSPDNRHNRWIYNLSIANDGN